MAYLRGQGERVGVVQVRLYRPFPAQALLDALPASVGRIAVLDRTKEPGSIGEPLFLDVVAALAEAHADGERAVLPLVTGGRYGLSSKEFTPGMVAGVFAELARERPRRRFTIGINDDVSGTSLPYDPSLDIEPPGTVRAVFFGLGSDGTVGANKNTIKILGAEENLHAQGYFVYDSKKSGSQTVSHLRFGPQPIRAPYLVQQAELRRLPSVRAAGPGRRARPGGAGRDAAAQLPPAAGRGLGRAAPPGPGADPRQADRRCTRSTPAGSPARSAWPGGPTPCCRPASSPSPACCPGTRRSPRSRRRSPRPTAAAAPRWSRGTRPRSTARSTGCTGSRCPAG